MFSFRIVSCLVILYSSAVIRYLPVLQFRSALSAESIGDPTLYSAVGTVFRFVLPWCAIHTVQDIRIVHGIAHPFAAFVAEVELFSPLFLPRLIQFFLHIVTAVWSCRYHRHSGCIAEEPIPSSAVLCDDFIGGGSAFISHVLSPLSSAGQTSAYFLLHYNVFSLLCPPQKTRIRGNIEKKGDLSAEIKIPFPFSDLSFCKKTQSFPSPYHSLYRGKKLSCTP